jgi:hypothetical protein
LSPSAVNTPAPSLLVADALSSADGLACTLPSDDRAWAASV